MGTLLLACSYFGDQTSCSLLIQNHRGLCQRPAGSSNVIIAFTQCFHGWKSSYTLWSQLPRITGNHHICPTHYNIIEGIADGVSGRCTGRNSGIDTLKPYLMDISPGAIIRNQLGYRNGEYFGSPVHAAASSISCSMVSKPPIPLPQITPARSKSMVAPFQPYIFHGFFCYSHCIVGKWIHPCEPLSCECIFGIKIFNLTEQILFLNGLHQIGWWALPRSSLT